MIKKCFVMFVSAIFLFFSIGVKASDNYYTESELNEGLYNIERVNFVNQGYLYNTSKVAVKDEVYVVCGGFDNELRPYIPYNYETFLYAAYYENNILKWTYSPTDFFGRFCDVIIEDDGITLLGEYEKTDCVSRVFLIKFDFSGNISKYYELYGAKNTYATRFFKCDNEYFVVGKTFDNNLEGNTIINDHSKIYGLKLDSDFQYQHFDYFGNDSINEIYQAEMINKEIYVLAKTNGDGCFKVDEDSYFIFSIDRYIELGYYEVIDCTGLVKLKNCFNYLTIFNYKLLSDELEIITFSSSITKIKSINVNLDTISSMVVNYDIDFQVYNGENIVILMNIFRKNDNYYLQNVFFDKDYNITFSSKDSLDKTRVYEFCYFDAGKLFMFGVNGSSYGNQIFGDKVIYVHLKNNECYFNGVKANKSIENLSEDVFGKYEGIISYSLNDMVIKCKKEVEVPLKSTVNEGEIYDLGVILKFNGEGYLNNVLISNEYVINETGVYVLKVVGNNKIQYINFEVKKLCLDIIDNQSYKNVAIHDSIIEDNNIIEKINYGSLDLSVEEDNSNYFYLIIIGFIGLCGGVLIPIRKKNYE